MKGKILIVEDDPDAATALGEMLSGGGYTVEVATTVTEAHARISEFQPNLLLLDISLPDGNGMLLAKTAQNLPSVVMTALPSFELLEPLGTSHVKYVLFKPCSTRTLLHTIQEALPANPSLAV